MNVARLANPIFGVIARTQRGREQLTADTLHQWAHLWIAEPNPQAWWIDQEVGIALFRPELVIMGAQPQSCAALAIRGTVYAGGRSEPPTGWLGLPPDSGTASILYDLLERDTAALRDLRGQFALAVWNGRRRQLLLARDHLGQRSFFTRTETHFLIFCSELAPLLRAQSTCELDSEAAVWYLSFGMPPPGRTLALGVNKIPAAHLLWWEPGNLPRVQRYWTPLTAEAPRDASPEVVQILQDALEQSIIRHCSREEPQGIFLSGGVDSTYLAATAAGCEIPQLYAFTSAFEEEYGMNETEYAAAVAEWLGLKHYVVPLHAREALELLDDVVLSAAEPCSAWATLTHFRLLASARQLDISQMLSGLGADEIFGGYDHFRGYYARYLRYCMRQATSVGIDEFDALLLSENQSSRRILYPGVARFFDDSTLRQALLDPYRTWQYASYLRSFYRECRCIKPDAHFMEMMVAHECQHRIPDLLFANFEAISRRMGVEVSYPFLDPDLVQLVTGLAIESRYRTASGRFSLRLGDLHPRFKHAMLLVAEHRVPEAIRDRPRKSFTAPFGGWLFKQQFAEPIISRLRRSHFWERNIVKPEWIDHALGQIVPGPNPAVFQLWALLTLIGWFDRFVEPPP